MIFGVVFRRSYREVPCDCESDRGYTDWCIDIRTVTIDVKLCHCGENANNMILLQRAIVIAQ